MGSVREVVKKVLSEYIVTILAVKDILEQIVPGFVHPTVDLTHVDTQTDPAFLVLLGGWDIIVLQHVMGLLEWIVSITALLTVSTRCVIDSTAVVCMDVKRVADVLRMLHRSLFLLRTN